MPANPARRASANGTHVKLAAVDLPALGQPAPLPDLDGALLESAAHDLLIGVGEDPARDGLIDTPVRVRKSLEALTEGYRLDPREVVGDALFEVEYDEMVLVRDIEIYSLCEHHLLPFFGKAHVAYLPRGQDRRPQQAPAPRRRLRPPAPGPGAADPPDRRVHPGDPRSGRRRRRDRGEPPLHDDARRREAAEHDPHEHAAGPPPRRRPFPRRVPGAGRRPPLTQPLTRLRTGPRFRSSPRA